jgi:hypothetical protein
MRRRAKSRNATSTVLACLATLLVACGAPQPPRGYDDPPPPTAEPLEFAFVAIDGSRVTSEALRGRNTVIAFVATFDTPSYGQVKTLTRVLHEHRPRINAVAMVLDPPQNRIMVESFGAKLPYPTVHADPATRAGQSLFLQMNFVPGILILDREGRPRYRFRGLAEPSVVEKALVPLDREATPP